MISIRKMRMVILKGKLFLTTYCIFFSIPNSKLLFFSISYIFIEYEKHESALEAVTQANNYKLDKQHTFLINLFSDYKK